jgi:hypothetical protein
MVITVIAPGVVHDLDDRLVDDIRLLNAGLRQQIPPTGDLRIDAGGEACRIGGCGNRQGDAHIHRSVQA